MGKAGSRVVFRRTQRRRFSNLGWLGQCWVERRGLEKICPQVVCRPYTRHRLNKTLKCRYLLLLRPCIRYSSYDWSLVGSSSWYRFSYDYTGIDRVVSIVTTGKYREPKRLPRKQAQGIKRTPQATNDKVASQASFADERLELFMNFTSKAYGGYYAPATELACPESAQTPTPQG